MGKGCVRSKKLEDLALGLVGCTARSRKRSESCACLWRNTWPTSERRGAHGQGKEQRKEARQEVRGEEWSEGDEQHGRLSREVAVEHRGSDQDTTRNQRGNQEE